MRIGIDIGGSKTEAVVVDVDGSISARARLVTCAGAAGVIGSARAAILAMSEQSGVPVEQFASIGIGIPGAVDSATGVVSHARNLGVSRLELAAHLGDITPAPIRVENDVNAAAVGAYHHLGGSAIHSLGYLNLGTGLAAGIVLAGEVWRGAFGTAGEIGHIIIDRAGGVDETGQPADLEMVASGSAIARQWGSSEPSATIGLFDAADRGDEPALRIATSLVNGVADAVRILVLTLDMQTVVIGGGLSRLGPRLIEPVRRRFAEWNSESSFIDSLRLQERVVVLESEVPVAALGAAYLGGTGWQR
ncbi:MAG: ROK family protein [Microbacteriaceae bacterium]